MNFEEPECDCPVCQEDLENSLRAVRETSGVQRAWALLELGRVYLIREDSEASLASVGAAEDIFREFNDEVGVATARLNRSLVFNSVYNYEDALVEANAAREVFDRNGMTKELASCYFSKANSYKGLFEPKRQLEQLKRARRIQVQLGRTLFVAMADSDIGEALIYEGRLADADRHLKTARANFSKLGFPSGVARADELQARLLTIKSDYRSASDKLKNASVIYQALGLLEDHARCLDEQGRVLKKANEPEVSIQAHKEALRVYQQMGAELSAAVCQAQMVSTLDRLGRHSEAIRVARRARRIFSSHPGWEEQVAWVDVDFAYSLAASGKVEAAKRNLKSAREFLGQLDLDPEDLESLEAQAKRVYEFEKSGAVFQPVPSPLRKGKTRRDLGSSG